MQKIKIKTNKMLLKAKKKNNKKITKQKNTSHSPHNRTKKKTKKNAHICIRFIDIANTTIMLTLNFLLFFFKTKAC